MVSKHRWSLNTGTIYIECTRVLIQKDGILTQVVGGFLLIQVKFIWNVLQRLLKRMVF